MRVAVVQMNSGEDKAQNLSTAERLLLEAAERGAELAVLPELFTYLGRRRKHREVAEGIPGPISELLARIARQRHLHVVGGSYLEAVSEQERFFNTCIAIDADGSIAARYRKLHLFDVDVDGNRYRESDTMSPGEDVVSTKLGDVPVGLTICYDLRFPELYRRLGAGGARIITRRPPSRSRPARTTGTCSSAPGPSRIKSSCWRPPRSAHTHRASHATVTR